MSCFLKRTWAEVNLDHILYNYRAIRSYIKKDCRVMAIVKADAYGHGARYVAGELQAAGADYFGVSNIEEALELRGAKIEKPILILGFTPVNFAQELIENKITQTIYSLDYARSLSQAALKAGGVIKGHIKLDTGMGRIGFQYNEKGGVAGSLDEIRKTAELKGLELEGIFTHFAVSDAPENDFTRRQFELFTDAVEKLRAGGLTFSLRHCCNSAGLLNFPEMQMDMVRPGIVLYGLTPDVSMKMPVELKPAMELKTVISQVKTLKEGKPVSYGMNYFTKKDTVIATLPIGYADGYARGLSNRADVLVSGHRAKIVGRICMDQCMVDITAIREMDRSRPVTIIGRDGSEEIRMEEIASLMGTINYETVCLIGKRVPRVLLKNGEQVGIINHILP